MLTTNSFSENHRGDFERRNGVSCLHLVVCGFSMLIMIYYLVTCVASFSGAIADMRKFGGLGFSYTFQHYLTTNGFWKYAGRFLVVFGEFFLYVILYRRVTKVKQHLIGVWYLAAMLLIHVAMCIYAIALDMPKSPPYIAENGVGMDFCVFAYFTGIQASAYFILHLSSIQKNRHKGEGDGATIS